MGFDNRMSVTLLDYMGSDLSVVNAARVSFHKESSHFDQGKDAKLIQYLAKHGHWSPFAHTSVSLRIKAPIFVARQLVKHQIGLTWNEVSRRYVKESVSLYWPEKWRKAAENVKQGSSKEEFLGSRALEAASILANESVDLYEKLLEEGLCPEQARMFLPQNANTEWIWTGSMLAFNRVYQQRTHEGAQEETRQVAVLIGYIVETLYPISWKALLASNKHG